MASTGGAFLIRLEEILPFEYSASAWIIALSVGVLLFSVFCVLSSTMSNAKVQKMGIPSPKLHPLLSTLIPLINILRNNSASKRLLLFQVICGYSKVFQKKGLWLFWGALRPIVILFKPNTVEPILNSSEVLQKGFEYEFLSLWLKEGLLKSKGKKWRYRRKLLTPAFHFRTLDEYIPVFNEQAKIFATKISETMQDNSYLDISHLSSLCTLDIICETAMGIKINAQSNSSNAYVQALHSSCKSAVDRILRVWLWPDFIYFRSKRGKEFLQYMKIMDTYTREVIAGRKQQKLKSIEINSNSIDITPEDIQGDIDIGRKTKKRQALLDILLDVHFKVPEFTLEDIAEEVDNFMFAGHDTTSSGISFALYMVGLNPKIQEKIHEEIDSVIGDDLEREITLENIKELKYLECCLKETRRLFPPTPFIAREVDEDVIIDGYTIPKGTSCGILIYMLHRDPEVFPNPEAFDPDRFSIENVTGRHPYAYVPFSAGPRNCIGQRFATFEAVTVMATILQRFELKSLDPLDKLSVVDELVIRSENGLRMTFKPRPKHHCNTE